METHALLVGVPLLLVAVLSVLIFARKGPHPASYTLSEKWTDEPILWSSAENIGGAHHGHGTTEVSVGGGASGKW